MLRRIKQQLGNPFLTMGKLGAAAAGVAAVSALLASTAPVGAMAQGVRVEGQDWLARAVALQRYIHG